MPIYYNNQTLFMAPRTHVIQSYAMEVDCDPFIYPMYKISNKWYKVSKGVHETVTPQILEPTDTNQWDCKSPSLFKGGLYTQEELEILRHHIMVPGERQAITGIMSRGMIGLSTDLQGTNIKTFMDEASIKKWIANTWTKFWDWFMVFGTAMAGCIGAYIVGKALKFIIDKIVHAIMLFDIFGWSFRLIVAFCDSVTVLFVHRHHKNNNNEYKNDLKEPTIELENVITVVPKVREETSEPVQEPNTNRYPRLETIATNTNAPTWLK